MVPTPGGSTSRQGARRGRRSAPVLRPPIGRMSAGSHGLSLPPRRFSAPILRSTHGHEWVWYQEKPIRTLDWLRQLGIDAAALGDDTLATGSFEGLTTILVGMFAFAQRPALAAARLALHAWVHAGGKLVTLYHRPTDAWDPDQTPPRRIAIGAPSYRWRVTDPAAPVRILVSDSRLMDTPNRIGPGDWDGWVRERGLYFASEWDSAYRPLLEIADPDMPALRGALLEAKIGRGTHIHVSLALHHQFESLVPGAFRLFSNMVSRP